MAQDKEDNKISFEKATERLETILEQMNSGTLDLERSLKLYEEAHNLVSECQKRLIEAEHKIEMLVKNRQGNIAVDSNNNPVVQDFNNR